LTACITKLANLDCYRMNEKNKIHSPFDTQIHNEIYKGEKYSAVSETCKYWNLMKMMES